MGTTTNYALPYPELTDPADVPSDIKKLAQAVDALPGAAPLPPRLGANPTTLTDWNTALTNGWYMGLAAANAPAGGSGWYIGEVIAHNSDYVTQEVWDFASSAQTATVPIRWRRSKVGAVWGSWVQVWPPTGGGGSGNATVATTVAGLGTPADGKIGYIRAGASPYEFKQVIYDATYGKWISPAEVIYASAYSMGQTWDYDIEAGHYAELWNAGLTPQVCMDWSTDSSYLGGDYNIRAYFRLSSAANNAAIGSSTSFQQTGGVYNAGVQTRRFMKGSWEIPASFPTVADLLILGLRISGDSGGSSSNGQVSARIRWVG